MVDGIPVNGPSIFRKGHYWIQIDLQFSTEYSGGSMFFFEGFYYRPQSFFCTYNIGTGHFPTYVSIYDIYNI